MDERGGVQPPRFHGARYQGHAGCCVVRGFFAQRPQALVGRVVAIVMALRLQVRAQQAEVLGFFGGHAQPVEIESARHAIEAPDGIEREVDGVELDVRNSMQQHGAPLRGGR